MSDKQLDHGSMPTPNLLNPNFEQKLLASQLVSEIHRTSGSASFTFTDAGVIAFAEALMLHAAETTPQGGTDEKKSFYLNENQNLVSKKELMIGFNISHTTLWKWQKTGYLVPIKVGKRIYYKKDDVEKLLK